MSNLGGAFWRPASDCDMNHRPSSIMMLRRAGLGRSICGGGISTKRARMFAYSEFRQTRDGASSESRSLCSAGLLAGRCKAPLLSISLADLIVPLMSAGSLGRLWSASACRVRKNTEAKRSVIRYPAVVPGKLAADDRFILGNALPGHV